MKRKNFILVILITIIAGTLLSREYPVAGFVVTITAMVSYLAVDAGRAFMYGKRYKTAGKLEKLRLVMWIVLLLVTLTSVFGGQISYLFLLVLLGIDYFLTDMKTG